MGNASSGGKKLKKPKSKTSKTKAKPDPENALAPARFVSYGGQPRHLCYNEGTIDERAALVAILRPLSAVYVHSERDACEWADSYAGWWDRAVRLVRPVALPVRPVSGSLRVLGERFSGTRAHSSLRHLARLCHGGSPLTQGGAGEGHGEERLPLDEENTPLEEEEDQKRPRSEHTHTREHEASDSGCEEDAVAAAVSGPLAVAVAASYRWPQLVVEQARRWLSAVTEYNMGRELDVLSEDSGDSKGNDAGKDKGKGGGGGSGGGGESIGHVTRALAPTQLPAPPASTPPSPARTPTRAARRPALALPRALSLRNGVLRAHSTMEAVRESLWFLLLHFGSVYSLDQHWPEARLPGGVSLVTQSSAQDASRRPPPLSALRAGLSAPAWPADSPLPACPECLCEGARPHSSSAHAWPSATVPAVDTPQPTTPGRQGGPSAPGHQQPDGAPCVCRGLPRAARLVCWWLGLRPTPAWCWAAHTPGCLLESMLGFSLNGEASGGCDDPVLGAGRCFTYSETHLLLAAIQWSKVQTVLHMSRPLVALATAQGEQKQPDVSALAVAFRHCTRAFLRPLLPLVDFNQISPRSVVEFVLPTKLLLPVESGAILQHHMAPQVPVTVEAEEPSWLPFATAGYSTGQSLGSSAKRRLQASTVTSMETENCVGTARQRWSQVSMALWGGDQSRPGDPQPGAVVGGVVEELPASLSPPAVSPQPARNNNGSGSSRRGSRSQRGGIRRRGSYSETAAPPVPVESGSLRAVARLVADHALPSALCVRATRDTSGSTGTVFEAGRSGFRPFGRFERSMYRAHLRTRPMLVGPFASECASTPQWNEACVSLPGLETALGRLTEPKEAAKLPPEPLITTADVDIHEATSIFRLQDSVRSLRQAVGRIRERRISRRVVNRPVLRAVRDAVTPSRPCTVARGAAGELLTWEHKELRLAQMLEWAVQAGYSAAFTQKLSRTRGTYHNRQVTDWARAMLRVPGHIRPLSTGRAHPFTGVGWKPGRQPWWVQCLRPGQLLVVSLRNQGSVPSRKDYHMQARLCWPHELAKHLKKLHQENATRFSFMVLDPVVRRSFAGVRRRARQRFGGRVSIGVCNVFGSCWEACRHTMRRSKKHLQSLQRSRRGSANNKSSANDKSSANNKNSGHAAAGQSTPAPVSTSTSGRMVRRRKSRRGFRGSVVGLMESAIGLVGDITGLGANKTRDKKKPSPARTARPPPAPATGGLSGRDLDVAQKLRQYMDTATPFDRVCVSVLPQMPIFTKKHLETNAGYAETFLRAKESESGDMHLSPGGRPSLRVVRAMIEEFKHQSSPAFERSSGDWGDAGLPEEALLTSRLESEASSSRLAGSSLSVSWERKHANKRVQSIGWDGSVTSVDSAGRRTVSQLLSEAKEHSRAEAAGGRDPQRCANSGFACSPLDLMEGVMAAQFSCKHAEQFLRRLSMDILWRWVDPVAGEPMASMETMVEHVELPYVREVDGTYNIDVYQMKNLDVKVFHGFKMKGKSVEFRQLKGTVDVLKS